MRALLLGATGLVGREILRLLAAEPACERVIVLARRALPEPPAKAVVHVVDFEHLERSGSLFGADAVFCALGTTMRQAGTRERFRAVDFGYPLAAARLARERGARHFLLVSALGASARSRVFYNRVKGELEDAILALGFPGVTIVRPSLLLGEREAFRLGERLMMPLGVLVPRRWRPVQARAVAAVLVQASIHGAPGVRVIESSQISQ